MRASLPVERAVMEGIDDARLSGTDAERYDERHPLFRYWHAALVRKSVMRDHSDRRVREHVLAEVRQR